MQLFYAPDIEVPYHTLGEEESKHCIRVLRLSCGDEIHLTDGRGNLYRAEITDDHPKHCTVRIPSPENRYGTLPYGLTAAVAPPKNAARLDRFPANATEGGTSSHPPPAPAPPRPRPLRPPRGEKVITAAMKQSLKAYRPELRPLTTFREAVLQPFDGQRFLAHCAPARRPEGKRYLPQAVRAGSNVEVFIGPAGDFSSEAIDLALAHGFVEDTLGDQPLRAETAARTDGGSVAGAQTRPPKARTTSSPTTAH